MSTAGGETSTESLLAPRLRPNTSVLVVSSLTAASIAFNSASITGYSSPTQIAIMEELGLSISQFSLVGSLQTVGLCLGGLLSRKMTDFLGHKSIMWILSCLFILGWLVIALAKVAWMLYLGTLLLGFGSEFQNYVVSAYTVEVSPQNFRGSFAALSSMATVGGIVFIYVMGSFVSWRWLAIIGTANAMLFMPSIHAVYATDPVSIFRPVSPRWLAKVGRNEDVASTLQWLRGKQADISLEATDIIESAKFIKHTSNGGFLDVFQKKYAISLIIGIGILAVHDSAGASAYASSSVVIFVSGGVSSFIGLISLSAVQVSSAGACLGSFITGLSFILQLYFGLYGPGNNPMDSSCRGAAASIGAVVSHFCSFVVSYYFNFWVEWSSAGTFFIFSAVCAVTFAFVAVLVPETKGKTLEEIQESLSSYYLDSEKEAGCEYI